ncbi:hypothetical protein PVAP13_5NG535200 [Panicum virgatum]|uniref:Uncharacterized protein n=1 Tax=Panicum virgatum TaxID=38727 RepID=A0A8T0S5A2_PANVG|nr:hypothetical protein PVAP13_5NG535200 [Panicum virgatum]
MRGWMDLSTLDLDQVRHRWGDEVDEQVLFSVDPAAVQESVMKAVRRWAENGEYYKKRGKDPIPPPMEILDHPDLFERAWGWDNIYPWDLVHPLAKYKRYLQDYYKHNQSEANTAGLNGDDRGNDLEALAHSCIKMENYLMFLLDLCTGITTDDKMEIRQTSEKISKLACQMANVLESEFPAAAVSLKCITKEAQLMCQLLTCQPAPCTFSIATSNDIRSCALSFMTYREHEYVPAAAAMMGIMKEAELMRESLRKPWHDEKANADMLNTSFIRDRTLSVMLDMLDECSSVGEPTGIPVNLNCSESDGITFPENDINENEDESNGKNSEKEVARNSPGARNGIDENKDESNGKNSNKEVARNSLGERNGIDENKDESNGKNSNKEVARNSLGERNGIDENKDESNGKNSNKEVARNSLGERNGIDENKFVDMLKIQLSPLDEKAGKKAEVEQPSPFDGKASNKAEVEHKKWKAGCFCWLKPGGRVNGAAGNNGQVSV